MTLYTRTVPAKLPRLALAADILAAILLVIATITLFAEGPTLYLGGIRIVSLRSASRIYLWAAILLIVRSWLVPQPRSFDRLRRAIREQVQGSGSTEQSHVSWREVGVVTLGYSILVAALTWPQAAHLYEVPDLGDPLFSIWRISWVSRQILHDPLALFDANIFHPERLTLTYSDPVILPSLVAAPFLWTGVHPVLVYNALLLSAFVLSGTTTYLLVRGLTRSPEAAFLSGAIFAVHPYRLEHYPHLELQMTMWMPLVLWGAHRTLDSGRLRDGLLTGLAYAAQALSSLYYGVFLAVYLVPFTIVLWMNRRYPWRHLSSLAAGGLLAAVVIAPLAWPFVQSRHTVGERGPAAVWEYSATLADYLEPVPRNRIYAGWAEGGRAERQLFPRLTPIVMTCVAFVPPWTPAQLAYAAGLLVALNGSLGFNGELYAWLYDYSGVVRGLRVPARFSILVGLSLAILSGYGLQRLIARWPRQRWLITGVVLAFVAIEAIPNLKLWPVWLSPPPIYAAIAGEDAVLAEFPMGEEYGGAFDARYQYFSTFHWRAMVNGNSGFFPPSHAALLAYARGFPSRRTLDYLRERHVTHLTVHGAFFGDERYRSIVNALDAEKDLELVVAVPWEGSESRLYRFR